MSFGGQGHEEVNPVAMDAPVLYNTGASIATGLTQFYVDFSVYTIRGFMVVNKKQSIRNTISHCHAGNTRIQS